MTQFKPAQGFREVTRLVADDEPDYFHIDDHETERFKRAQRALQSVGSLGQNLAAVLHNACYYMAEFAPDHACRQAIERKLYDFAEQVADAVRPQAHSVVLAFQEAHPHRAEQIMRNELDGRVR